MTQNEQRYLVVALTARCFPAVRGGSLRGDLRIAVGYDWESWPALARPIPIAGPGFPLPGPVVFGLTTGPKVMQGLYY